MKKILKILIPALLALALVITLAFAMETGWFFPPSQTVISVSNTMGDLLIAHRGFSGVAPENTIAAAVAARDAGFSAMEFDVRLSADGEWYVMHDEDVDRMSDGTGKVSELTEKGLKYFRIDAGNGIEQYPDQRIPTLEQMLCEVVIDRMTPVVDVKTFGADRAAYEKLVDTLKTYVVGRCFVVSFDLETLRTVKALYPDATYMLLTHKVTAAVIRECAEAGVDGVDFNARRLTNWRHIRTIREAGMTAAAWTVDNLREAEALYKRGVEYLTSNIIKP